jgi:hypothetical protein
VLPEVVCWLRLRVRCLALKAVVTDGATQALRQALTRLAHEQLHLLASAVADLALEKTGLRLWN